MGLPDVIAITDAELPDDELLERAIGMLKSAPRGAVGVQLRDRERPGGELLRLAEKLRAACSAYGAPFYVNDRIDIALAVAADGAHLGGRSLEVEDARALLGPDAFLSVAAHGADDVERAEASGVTAALLSPIFATPGKGSPLGLESLANARRKVRRLRLYALGGIDATNAAACMKSGAQGVAVVRALWRAPEIETALRALLDEIRRGKLEHPL
jgi:thiamine-phosphate pyrophosphorylase